MILTEKEIKTLEAFKGKMEYVEVEAIGVGGVKVIVKKLVKVGATKKTKKENPVMKMVAESKEMTSVEAQDVMEASRKRQMKNL